MKTFLTFIILTGSFLSFGQKTVNLNFTVVSQSGFMPFAEILFYTTDTDKLLHFGTADKEGNITWNNAPRTNLKAVFFDSTYIYEPKTMYFSQKELSSEKKDLHIVKLSDSKYKALQAAREPASSDSIPDILSSDCTQAEYTGGREALVKFLQQTIRVPESAEEEGLKGKVYLLFAIEKDGSIKNLEVKKSLTPDTDFAAMITIAQMPKWKPAECNGVKVPTYYTLPIMFSVQ